MGQIILGYFRKVRRLEIHIFAAYAAYFLLLSIFPAMMLLVSILQLTPISLESLRDLLRELVPASLHALTDYMIDELFAVDAPAVVSISAVTALWMTTKGILSLQRGLNRIYLTRETRNALGLRLRALLFSLAGILGTVLLLGLQLATQDVISLLLSEGSPLGTLLLDLGRAKHLLAVLLLTGFFTVVYAVFPNRPVRLKRAFPGALATAVLWTVFSRLFSLYVEGFTNYSLYYGSLSVIAAAMLWLYVCIFLFFCGGLLNMEIERYKDHQIWTHRDSHSSEEP